MSGLGWYVVQSHARKESFVRERVEDLGREAFLPLVAERKSGRFGPLFPCYLFARLSEKDGDLPRVRWMHGVRKVLGSDRWQRPVEEAVVQSIRSRADRAGVVRLGTRADPRLRRGSRVRIVEGPLEGLIAMLERPMLSPEERVCVLLELFHRPVKVEVPGRAIAGFAGV